MSDEAVTAPVMPSGEQFALRAGEWEAVVTEVGATLRSLAVGGRELLDTFAADEMCHGSRGQALLPWPNRIAGGQYTFNGQTNQAPISEPKTGNASHGLTRWLPWLLLERIESAITLGLLLYPQPGYPFTLALELTYTLTGSGLTVRTVARNAGTTPLPFGAGYHPYFTAGTEFVDTAVLQVPAATYLTTDERLIPTGHASVAGSPFDFRAPRAIGDLRIDTCFTDLQADADGQTRVRLAHPSGAPIITLTLDAAHQFVQVYTGDTLPAPARRRGVAIEPMTCPANAFNSGAGLRVLAPGESCAGQWRVGVG
jgi:aldose 1-epimerase